MAFYFDGNKQTHAQVTRDRKIAEALAARATGRMPRDIGEGLNAIGAALGSRIASSRANSAMEAGRADANAMLAEALAGTGGGSSSPTVSGTIPPSATLPEGSMDLKSGIQDTAIALGVDPVDLATVISYETAGTFDPTKAGPTTQWGQHKGLIQFGEPQAEQYGVDWNDPVGSQLGPKGAIAKYMLDAGVEPGMGLLDMYSAVNAGQVGRYNASDANNGGAPGTVRDKVENQMAGHRAKAEAMFPMQGPIGPDGPSAMSAPALTDQPVQVAQAAPVQPTLTPQAMAEILGNPYLTDAQRQFALSQYQRQQGPNEDQLLDRQLKQARLEQLQQPEDNSTSAMREYELAQSQGFAGSFLEYQKAKQKGMRIQTNPDGTMTFEEGPGVGGGAANLNELQSKNATFATRAAGALEKLDASEQGLTGWSGVVGSSVGQVPLVGNFIKSEDYQTGEQAGEEFLQAILRKDTGAAITEPEQFLYGETYLPKPGDGEPELKQKRQSRQRALEALQAGMTPEAIEAMTRALRASMDEEAARKREQSRGQPQAGGGQYPASAGAVQTQGQQAGPQNAPMLSVNDVQTMNAESFQRLLQVPVEELQQLPDEVLEALEQRYNRDFGGQ